MAGGGRRSIRLATHDYTTGAYFVTLSARERRCLFGEIADDDMQVSPLGEIADVIWKAIPSHFPWVDLDAFVVMPNHVHGILILHQRDRRGVQLNAPTPPRSKVSPNRGKGHTSSRVPTSPRSGSLSVVIRTYKAAVTAEARRSDLAETVWQRGFYEHVIRTEKDLQEIRSYILTNPLRWALDEENPSRHR